tara:strand:- start:357 stop:473 length:117 start_codon:yes stop_codon:yes gene_type:complete
MFDDWMEALLETVAEYDPNYCKETGLPGAGRWRPVSDS